MIRGGDLFLEVLHPSGWRRRSPWWISTVSATNCSSSSNTPPRRRQQREPARWQGWGWALFCESRL